jgi:uncharacterized protein YndB with AHSA1/START domain
MEHMEGILAIVGFWVCMIALALKKPMTAFIELKRTKAAEGEGSKLAERVQQLESAVVTMGKDIQEVKDTSEFAHKLLIDSAQQIAEAHKLITNNAQQLADAQRMLATTKRNDLSGGTKVTVLPEPIPEPKRLTAGPLVNDLGKVIGDGTVRFERLLPAPIERVWQYLTASDCLSQWLAVGSVDQRFGGKVDLTFDVDEMPERREKGHHISGVINFIEPLRALAFSWNDLSNNVQSNVSVQLSSQGENTSLVLTHSQLPADRMSEFMAGWHTHLDVLKARLIDAVPPDFRKRYREVFQTYVAVVATTVVISTAATAQAVSAAPSAEAYQSIQIERAHALSRYDAIARDADQLKKQIADLKRDMSPEAARTVDSLEKQLADHNRDLRDLNFAIRDMDNALR